MSRAGLSREPMLVCHVFSLFAFRSASSFTCLCSRVCPSTPARRRSDATTVTTPADDADEEGEEAEVDEEDEDVEDAGKEDVRGRGRGGRGNGSCRELS